MKAWTLCLAMAITGGMLVPPTLGADEPVVGPPPSKLLQQVGGLSKDVPQDEVTASEPISASAEESRPDDPGDPPGDGDEPFVLPLPSKLISPTRVKPEPPASGQLARRTVHRCGAGCCGCPSGCISDTTSPSCARCCCDPCVPWTLPQPGFLQFYDIRLGGWIDQGISVVANNPRDRYNGPVTFNDRDDEYQMNQLWLFVERQVDTGGCGWDIGGRIDFVYGTDARFTQAADGLEANWDQTEPFYQVALPQFYLDVGWNDWMVRMGHFYTIIGYEVVPAPDNFFYSHSYTMQYAEPFTHTGILFFRDVGPQWSFVAGMHRGTDQFDDTDGLNALNYLGGVSWTSCDERLSATFAISVSEQSADINLMVYSVVGTWKITDRLAYAIQHDLGDADVRFLGHSLEWYGLNQYLLYEINDCWSAGLRFEWFRDDDGVRVMGLGVGNQSRGLPPNPPHFVGDFYEITAGLNWRPTANITVRPEARWDWFDPDLPTPLGNRPYDAGDRNGQFLFGCDLIVTF